MLAKHLVVAAVVDDGVLSVNKEISIVRTVVAPSIGALGTVDVPVMEADGVVAMVDTLAAIVVLWVIGAGIIVVASRRLLMTSTNDRQASL